MSCGGGSFARGCLRFCLGRRVYDWKLHFLFPVPEDAGYFCVLNAWFSSNDEVCADNNNYSQFKLKDKCRSAKWEVYLTVLMTI